MSTEKSLTVKEIAFCQGLEECGGGGEYPKPHGKVIKGLEKCGLITIGGGRGPGGIWTRIELVTEYKYKSLLP